MFEGGLVKKIIISIASVGLMIVSVWWAVNKIKSMSTPTVSITAPSASENKTKIGQDIFDNPKFKRLKDNSINFTPPDEIKTGNRNPFQLPMGMEEENIRRATGTEAATTDEM